MHEHDNVPSERTPSAGIVGERYRLLCTTGTTSVGVTYRGWDLERERAVDVELLPRGAFAGPRVRARLEQSAYALRSVRDPRCAQVFDVGVSELGSFLVSEPVRAEALAPGAPRVPLAQALEWGHEVALALGAAHRRGVLHGALEPARVALLSGSSPRIKLGGFGLAAWLSELRFTARARVRPLYGYLTPEHAAGRPLEVRSDVYACGALLYAFVTGAAPFEGCDAGDVLCRHLDDEPRAPSARLGQASLPLRVFDKIVLRCLRKAPSERYPSALDLARDLARLRAALATEGAGAARGAARRAERIVHHPPRRSHVTCTRPLPKVIVNGHDADAERASA